MRYYLGPYVWRKDAGTDCYCLPDGATAATDLRPLSEQSRPNVPSEKAFVASESPLGSAYHELGVGDCRELRVGKRERDLWESVLGYRPSGDTLADFLYDHLTTGSDPEGQDRCASLMPNSRRRLEVRLQGHGVVKSEMFAPGDHPHWNKVRECLHRQYRGHYEQSAKATGKGRDHYRRVVDYWCQQYGLPRAQWQVFVPTDMVRTSQPPVKHETSYSDDFDRADSTTLGGSWTEQYGEWLIASNAIETASPIVIASARYDADLSSSNSQASAVIAAIADGGWLGPTVRHSATDKTFYDVFLYRFGATWQFYLRKTLSGTETTLAGGVSVSPTLPSAITVRADGDTITGLLGESSLAEVTDSASKIASGLRCGLAAYSVAGSRANSWQASDIAPSVGIRYTQLESTHRGMFRGVYTGGM
jgi:hypothetical protein